MSSTERRVTSPNISKDGTRYYEIKELRGDGVKSYGVLIKRKKALDIIKS